MPLVFQNQSVRLQRAQSGFSLVEILVGLVIGLLVTLVIMQVFSVFEGQKRSTTGTADAQTNGNIALYNLQRDVQVAGFGLPVYMEDNNPLLCTDVGGLSPVIIADGAAAGDSDTITVHYGSSSSGGAPVTIALITPIPTAEYPDAIRVGVDNNLGCQVNDIALVVKGSVCKSTKVIGPTDIRAILPVPSTPPDLNTRIIELEKGTDITLSASLSCMGSGWGAFVYRVNNNQLELNGIPNVAEIVNMQAQYGVSDTRTNNRITSWVNASGATWGSTTMTVADRNRIKAIRVAIVARNGLLEKDIVTETCTTNKGTVNNGPCAWDDTSMIGDAAPMIDLSSNADWQHYRYRVYETIIPIRSMIWSAKVSTF